MGLVGACPWRCTPKKPEKDQKARNGRFSQGKKRLVALEKDWEKTAEIRNILFKSNQRMILSPSLDSSASNKEKFNNLGEKSN